MSTPTRLPSLLYLLLNIVLKSKTGRPLIQPTSRATHLARPHVEDREAWRIYWKTQGLLWRTEPEIDSKRQAYLIERQAITPNIEHGIYPFKDIKLERADVEWLLHTHQEKHGPVEYIIGSPSKGIDLRGAILCSVDLSWLPLTQIRGGLPYVEWISSTKEQREAAAIHLESANLTWANLTWASLRSAHLEGAVLNYAHLEGAHLNEAHFEGDGITFPPADLRNASFNHETRLDGTILGKKKTVRVADTRWNDVNLAVVKWSQVDLLGDEHEARQKRQDGKKKDSATHLKEHEEAIRANRQLATALQDQGLNEDASRFAYRAQVLQRDASWFQMTQQGMRLRQRMQAFGAWLFSWLLFLLAGYGYRLWRSFLAYMIVIIGFTTAYYLLGAAIKPSLSLVNALGLSMTSFHGRGFFPGVTQLSDSLTILASIEAFVGLVLEATFIATLTQRFFGK